MKWSVRILCFLIPVLSYAQYGNEWINHSRPYYKFKINDEGIYRIDSLTLANSGIPVNSIDPQTFGLYNREKEVAIYVEGEDDGVFDGSDFIEFYAQGNDGWLDEEVYDTPEHQSNPYYSLFNDTIYYYFTWEASPDPLRAIEEDDADFASYTPIDWFWAESQKSIGTNYYPGYQDQNGLSLPGYGEAEGWFSSRFPKGAAREYFVPIRQHYTGVGAPAAIGTAVCASTNNASNGLVPNHHVQVHYGSPPNILALDTIFAGYQLNKLEFPIQPAELNDGNAKIRVSSVDGLPGLDPSYPDYNAVAYIKIRYAQAMHMSNALSKHLYIPYNQSESKTYLSWTALAGSDPIMYTLTDPVMRLLPVSTGTTDEVLVPNALSGDETHCFVQRPNSVAQVDTLVPVTPTGYFADLEVANPDSAFVIVTSSKFLAEATAYAAYRSSNPYNQFQTLVVTVEELYDQYGGGIPHHALSLRRFADMMVHEWNTRPNYLFLIGKSVMQAELAGSNLGSRKHAIRYTEDLLPTYGFPPSDIAFTAGLETSMQAPAIPTGRLSAKSPSDVTDYLGKVMVQEAQLPDEWMKRVIHFRGGSNINEWQLFDYYLNNYETIVEDTCFGGFVHNFKKYSSDIIEEQLSDSVTWLINNGVSLMTFFGHSSGSGFDINIDFPGNYEWNGHHPLMMGLSCFTGNIHLYTANSTSEQFVMAEDKGAIGFIASVDAGLSSQLNNYAYAFYTNLAKTHYGKGVGDLMRQTVIDNLTNSSSYGTLNNVLSMTLHGDPAIVLNAHERPDFSLSAERVSFFPADVDAQLEEFDVRVVVDNIGKAVNDSIEIKLRRTFPDGQDSTYIKVLSRLYHRDTITFTIPVYAQEGGIGVNNLEVSVDLGPDVVPELDDLGNNIVTKELFIRSGAILPAWPYEYQVILDPEPTLKASTGDPFAPPKDYLFQIDTTDLFNSPLFESTTINSAGGVLGWGPQNIFNQNNLSDSTVFFWRTSPDSSQAQELIWKESSFQFIPEREGWGQAHYFQFKNDKYDQVVYDRPEREYDFFTGSRQVRCNVKGNPQAGEFHLTEWYIDLDWQDGGGCNTVPAFQVAVIDPETFEPWGTMYGSENIDHSFGNVNDGPNCNTRVEYYFIFRPGVQSSASAMLDMLENQVPDGHYVLIYSWLYMNRSGTQEPGLFPYIESMGGDSITQIPDSVPYIFFVKKGEPSSALEVWGETINDQINLSVSVPVNGNTGAMSSVVAGPTSQWKGLFWSQHAKEQPTQDSTRVKLFGIALDGSEQELIDAEVGVDSIVPLYDFVDAQTYPYVRLQAYLNEVSANPTPAQMDRWHLLHDPVPEAAINPNIGYFISGDTLFEGEEISIAISVENISDYDMDSLLVAYTVEDRNHTIHPIPYQRQAPLPAGAVLYDTLTLTTIGFGGLNRLRVEVNPIDPNTGYFDQLEQYHFNNIAEVAFNVNRDITNPLLDVTFDGLHILDGDIISTQPEITISLDDENPWLIMESVEDTALFKFFMTYPDGVVEQIFFRNGMGEEILQFEPADGPDNIAHIYYRPKFEQDGMHTLQVRASDISSNASGDLDHQVRFEVIQRATITDVLNYPNPFTTKTQFVFTVTGAEAPTYVQIQIMTITGRVVREISNHELGPLRVGRNVTDFYWDGTDQFGDRLAQGVYLYKVTAKLHGEDIENRETGASSYFKKGIGKMYLLGR